MTTKHGPPLTAAGPTLVCSRCSRYVWTLANGLCGTCVKQEARRTGAVHFDPMLPDPLLLGSCLELVRELAATMPANMEGDCGAWCAFCGAGRHGNEDYMHEPSCLWRRAKELVG